MTSPAQRFAVVVEDLAGEPGVTPPATDLQTHRGFGSNGLKVHNRIFAMFVRGNLVVKLPSLRVSALIAAGHAEPFDAGKGRPMKEWAAVSATSEVPWVALAREAMEFVARRHSRVEH